MSQLVEISEIAKFSKKELRKYEDSLKAYRDIKNSLDTAEEKGRKKGKEEVLLKLLVKCCKMASLLKRLLDISGFLRMKSRNCKIQRKEACRTIDLPYMFFLFAFMNTFLEVLFREQSYHQVDC